jgi:hypothetical protein
MLNPFAAAVAVTHVADLQHENEKISSKVYGSFVGGLLATILWTLLVQIPGLKEHLGDTGVTAITGATGTVFVFLLGYLVADPVRTATSP